MSAGAWLALAGLGAFHGLNPAMGWLFAVALGLHRGGRSVVLWSTLPIALGHAASVAVVLVTALLLELVVDGWWLRRLAGLVLLGNDQVSVTSRSFNRRTTLAYGVASDRLSAGTTVAPHDRAAACATCPVSISAYGVRTRKVSVSLMPTRMRAYRSTRSTQSASV